MTRRSAARRPRRSPYRQFGGIAVGLGLGLALGIALFAKIDWLAAWLLGWGVVAFALYGFDKRQAKASGGRVPELVLHGVALVGGVFGAWLGRGVFRHKTQHQSFTLVLALATVVWLAAAWWRWWA